MYRPLAYPPMDDDYLVLEDEERERKARMDEVDDEWEWDE